MGQGWFSFAHGPYRRLWRLALRGGGLTGHARSGLRRAWPLPRPPKRLALEESGKDGRVATTSLDFIMGGSSTQPDPLASGGGRLWASAPVTVSVAPSTGPMSPARERQRTYGRPVCPRSRPICWPSPPGMPACRAPSGPWNHGGRSPPALPVARCAPGSRESDARDYGGGFGGVDKRGRLFFTIE